MTTGRPNALRRLFLRMAGVRPSSLILEPTEEAGLIKSITTGQALPPSLLGRPAWTNYSTERALAQGYNSSVYVNALVSIIAESAASVPWKVKVRSSRTETWEEAPDHPLQVALDEPNQFMTRRMLMERAAGHLLLAGNAIWAKIRVNGQVEELWPLNPDQIKVVPDARNYISHYEYGHGANKKIIKPEDVLHFMRTNYSTTYWGQGQLEVGMRLLDLSNKALDWENVVLSQQAIIPGIVGVKSKISDKQRQNLEEMMAKRRLGGADVGKDLIIGSDLTYQRLGANPAEMQSIESRKLNREDLCVLFRVPPPMIGIYEDATLSNIEEAHKIFWRTRVIPFLGSLKDAVNLGLTPEFGDPETLYVEPDFTEVEALQDNFKEKADTAATLVRIGFKATAVNRRLNMGFNDDDIDDDRIAGMSGFASGPDGGMNNREPAIEAAARPQRQVKAATKMFEAEYAKLAYWKNFDDQRRNFETEIADEVAKQFTEEAEAVSRSFRADGLDGALRAVTIQEQYWRSLLNATYIQSLRHFGQFEYDQVVGQVSKQATYASRAKEFNPLTPEMTSWLTSIIGRHVTYITDTTKARIATLIMTGFADGLTLDEISDALTNRYVEWGDLGFEFSRALMIARTEIGTVANYGAYAGAIQARDDLQVNIIGTWISSRDGRVRDSHSEMDGQSVPIGETFSNGLLYPNDPNGSAEEVINCRCAVGHEVIL